MATVVVTGATGAVGSATVEALTRRRANVIKLSRPSFDLSSFASVRAAARELNRNGGHIDALLNIAAVLVPAASRRVVRSCGSGRCRPFWRPKRSVTRRPGHQAGHRR